ncbi:YceD family protein [Yoonia sp. MH D7]
MSDLPTSHLRLSDLASRKATPFNLAPNTNERMAIAAALGIVAIKKLTFTGTITPVGRTDWNLRGTLGATVVQDCVVTLAPVTSRVDDPVQRTYMADVAQIEEPEVEMTADENIEHLPTSIDLYSVLIEALSLGMPAYPRAPDAELGDAVFAKSGIAPMTDEDAKPFAGLGDLRKALESKDE